jgi:hypothetical protein
MKTPTHLSCSISSYITGIYTFKITLWKLIAKKCSLYYFPSYDDIIKLSAIYDNIFPVLSIILGYMENSPDISVI